MSLIVLSNFWILQQSFNTLPERRPTDTPTAKMGDANAPPKRKQPGDMNLFHQTANWKTMVQSETGRKNVRQWAHFVAIQHSRKKHSGEIAEFAIISAIQKSNAVYHDNMWAMNNITRMGTMILDQLNFHDFTEQMAARNRVKPETFDNANANFRAEVSFYATVMVWAVRCFAFVNDWSKDEDDEFEHCILKHLDFSADKKQKYDAKWKEKRDDGDDDMTLTLLFNDVESHGEKIAAEKRKKVVQKVNGIDGLL